MSFAIIDIKARNTPHFKGYIKAYSTTRSDTLALLQDFMDAEAFTSFKWNRPLPDDLYDIEDFVKEVSRHFSKLGPIIAIMWDCRMIPRVDDFCYVSDTLHYVEVKLWDKLAFRLYYRYGYEILRSMEKPKYYGNYVKWYGPREWPMLEHFDPTFRKIADEAYACLGAHGLADATYYKPYLKSIYDTFRQREKNVLYSSLAFFAQPTKGGALRIIDDPATAVTAAPYKPVGCDVTIHGMAFRYWDMYNHGDIRFQQARPFIPPC